MSELRDLYQQVILDHNRAPRNFRRLEGASRRAEGNNPLCGDRITVYVVLDGDVIRDIAFQGQGCAIDRAAASLMTEAVKGKSVPDAERLFESFHRMVTGDGDGVAGALGKLEVLAGVREFPVRVKCATLPWHTLRASLREPGGTVSTE